MNIFRKLNFKFRETTKDLVARQYNSNSAYITDVTASVVVPEYSGSETIRTYFAPAVKSDRPIVFTCPHWGSYFQSFTLIGNSFPGSDFVVFRGPKWRDDEDKLWERINTYSKCDVSVFRVLERNGLRDVYRRLRNGSNAFILFDLHAKFGETSTIEIFNEPINITYKWTELAYLASAVVVFIKPFSVERNWIEVIDVIDSKGFSNKSDYTSKCLDACKRSLENLISERSEFWFMWPEIHKFQFPVEQ